MYRITLKDAVTGAVLFSAGDSIGTLITGDFMYQRMLAMMLLGGSLYAWEIPGYFSFLQRRFNQSGYLNALKRTFSAAFFFNPLWIARHLVFIKVFSGEWMMITSDILVLATQSFVYCFPFSILANYLILNVISYKWRFFSSSIYSALTVIYFALSAVIFTQAIH